MEINWNARIHLCILYICVCMCVDTVFIFGHTQRHTLIQIHMYVYIYIHVCMYLHMYVYIYIYTHIYVCVYIHIHTYIYTHTYVGTYTHICKRIIAVYSINNGNPLVVKLLVIPNTCIKCFYVKTAFLL